MKRVLLIIGGGIGAYKSLEVIRLLGRRGVGVVSILTRGGKEFITPLSVSGVSGAAVYERLFSPKDESEMGHIRLSREADAILVCPGTADLLSKMALGRADDLASATLLAADKEIFVAPAMNVRMWEHAAVRANVGLLRERGVRFIGPIEGDMACGEYGMGHLSEPEVIAATMDDFLHGEKSGILRGKRVLVTAGPTYERLDAVRFIGNYSSGKQGYAFAEAFRDAGAHVILVSGHCQLAPPHGVDIRRVTSAQDMLEASLAALPCDIALCAAAVADWQAKVPSRHKLKKGESSPFASLSFTETPDILRHLACHKDKRPSLVIGFAAESDNLRDYGRAKLKEKGCDIILANDIENSTENSVFGSDENQLLWLDKKHEKLFARQSKTALAKAITIDIMALMKKRGDL